MSGAEQGPPADASGRNGRMHRNVVSSCLARCSASRQRVLRHRTMCPLRYGGSSRGRRAKTCHRRRCFDAHADEQNHGSLARTAKAFRSGNWSAKRAAPAAERCSCAVLEYRLSMRFAVTCQGELTRSRGSMHHSNTGFDPERSYALIHYRIQINGRQRSNNISHSTREDVCACGLVAPVTRNPQRR